MALTETQLNTIVDNVSDLVEDYLAKKHELDAAYTTFKNDPTIGHSGDYMKASQAFTQYCVNQLGQIYYVINSDLTDENVTDDMIAASEETFEEYRTCKACEKPVLYYTGVDVETNKLSFIRTTDFMPSAKGWCYDCLVAHCKNHGCNETSCLLAQEGLIKPDTCQYRALKALHQLSNKT